MIWVLPQTFHPAENTIMQEFLGIKWAIIIRMGIISTNTSYQWVHTKDTDSEPVLLHSWTVLWTQWQLGICKVWLLQLLPLTEYLNLQSYTSGWWKVWDLMWDLLLVMLERTGCRDILIHLLDYKSRGTIKPEEQSPWGFHLRRGTKTMTLHLKEWKLIAD